MANILAVDDDEAILVMLRRILEKDGHTVTIVSDPAAAGRMRLDRKSVV